MNKKSAGPAPRRKATEKGAPVGIIVGAIAGVVVLAGIGVGVFLWLRSGSATTTTDNSGTTVAQTNSNQATSVPSGSPQGAESGPAATTGIPAPGNPAAGVAGLAADEGGENPEATWTSFTQAQNKSNLSGMIRLITPESRRSGIIEMVNMVRNAPVPDSEAKLKAALTKRGADPAFLDKIPKSAGKQPGERNTPFSGEVPLNVVDGLQDFISQHAPTLLSDRNKDSRMPKTPEKVEEVEINGDTATGDIVMESVAEGFITEQDENGKSRKKAFSKKFNDRQTMHFRKISGRWFLDFEAEKSGARKTEKETVQRERERKEVTIDQGSARSAYLSFQQAMKGSDWRKAYAILAPPAQIRWMINCFSPYEGDISALARNPNPNQKGYPRMGDVKALLTKNNLEAKKISDWLSAGHYQNKAPQLPEAIKSMPHPENLFADLMELSLRSWGSTSAVGQHTHATLLGVNETGDTAVAIVRTIEGHAENPYNLDYYPCTRVAGQWRLDDARTPELYKQRKELAAKLIPTDSKLAKIVSVEVPKDSNSDAIGCIVQSPDGKTLVASGYAWKNVLHRWDGVTGASLPEITGPENSRIGEFCFTHDGKSLVAVCAKPEFGPGECHVAVMDVATGKVTQKLPVPKDPKEPSWKDPDISKLAVSPNGKYAVGTSFEGKFHSWDLSSGKLLNQATPDKHNRAHVLRFTSDSAAAIAGYGYHNVLHLFDPATLRQARTIEVNARNKQDRGGQSNSVNDLAYSPDGKWLAVGFEFEIQLWDAAGRKMVRRIQVPINGQRYGNAVQHLCWSPDSRSLFSSTHDNELQQWEPTSGRQVASFLGHWDRPIGIAVSADNSTLISASADGEIRFWNIPGASQSPRRFEPPKQSDGPSPSSLPAQTPRASSAVKAQLKDFPRGLMHWWSLDRNSRDEVATSHGNNVGPVNFVPAVSGNGIRFQSGAGIKVPDIELSESFTLSVWIEPQSAKKNGLNFIFFRGDERPGLDPVVVALTDFEDGKPGWLRCVLGSEKDEEKEVRAPIKFNQFQHAAVVFNAERQNIELYLDGKLLDSTPFKFRPAKTLQATKNAGIGIGNSQNPESYNEPFDGVIDEVQLYSRPLTAAEVESLHALGVRLMSGQSSRSELRK